jgi:hypothetical protein
MFLWNTCAHLSGCTVPKARRLQCESCHIGYRVSPPHPPSFMCISTCAVHTHTYTSAHANCTVDIL